MSINNPLNIKWAVVCEHGQLKRSCQLCEYEEEIAELKSELAEKDRALGDAVKEIQAWKLKAESVEKERVDE